MNHNFNPKIALKFGVDEAIFLNNLAFWMQKNESNNKNFINGYYWTYNSYESLSNIFFYWSPSKIKRIVKKLRQNNIIATDNFNKFGFDKTLWYTILDKEVYEQCLGDSYFKTEQKRTTDSAEPSNRKNNKAQPKRRDSTPNTIYKNNIKKHISPLPLVRDFKDYNFNGPESFSNCLQDFDREKKLKGLSDEDFRKFSAKWREDKKESEIAFSYFNKKPLTA